MLKSIEEKLFLLIAFFIGTWGALYNVAVPVLLTAGIILHVVRDRRAYAAAIRQYRLYLAFPAVTVLYLAVHTLVILQAEDYASLEPGFGMFEKLLQTFLPVPFYLVGIKSLVTPRLLKKWLAVYCLSVISYNVALFFFLSGPGLFTAPWETLSLLYESRFGFGPEFWGGVAYLDAQAMQIYAAILITYCGGMTLRPRLMKTLCFSSALLLLFFLSLTVTKSAFLSFGCGFLLFNIFFLRKIALKYRWMLVASCLLLASVFVLHLPASVEARWQQVVKEIRDLREGKLSGGDSITPRFVMYKACVEHIDEWGWLGLGVFTEKKCNEWFTHSENEDLEVHFYSHNSYLQYWMRMGIWGLAFILSWFVVPVVHMWRNRKYSFLALSILAAFFIDCNFEIQLIVDDGLNCVLFLLVMFYLLAGPFRELEQLP